MEVGLGDLAPGRVEHAVTPVGYEELTGVRVLDRAGREVAESDLHDPD